MGRLPHKDVSTSQQISDLLGISGGKSPFFNFPADYLYRFNAELSGGARDSGAVVSPLGFEDLVHFAGTYAGISKSAESNVVSAVVGNGGTMFEAVEELVQRRLRVGAATLLTKQSIEAVAKTTQQNLSDLAQAVPLGFIWSENYRLRRSRTHYGLNSFAQNKGRVLPDLLANRFLAVAGSLLPADMVNTDKVFFDLLSLSPIRELLLLPFADGEWSRRLLPEGGIAPLASTGQVKTRSRAPMQEDGAALNDTIKFDFPRDPERKLLSGGRVTNSQTPQLAQFERNASAANYFLDLATVDDNVWETFERKAVIDLIRTPREDLRVDGIEANSLGVFISAMAWRFGLEEHAQLRKVCKFKEFTGG